MAIRVCLPINAASERRIFRVNFRTDAAFEDAAFIRGWCLLEASCVYKRAAFKKRKYGKVAATIFSSRWQCNFKKLLHYHPEENIALVACLALAMQHLLTEVAEILQTNILAIHLSASLAIAPCSRVAIFPRDGSAIISENCIAIAGEKKNCSCSLSLIDYLR